MEFIIVTGLSGAGKTQAMHSMEDIGFFCVDNLPPALIPVFYDLCLKSESAMDRVAVVTDTRGAVQGLFHCRRVPEPGRQGLPHPVFGRGGQYFGPAL